MHLTRPLADAASTSLNTNKAQHTEEADLNVLLARQPITDRMQSVAAGAVVCDVVALGAGVGLVFRVGSVSRWMPAAVLVGYGSHLRDDFVTVRGVPLLWPLSNRRQRVTLIGATDERREQLVCLGAGALGVYLAFTLDLREQLSSVRTTSEIASCFGADARRVLNVGQARR